MAKAFAANEAPVPSPPLQESRPKCANKLEWLSHVVDGPDAHDGGESVAGMGDGSANKSESLGSGSDPWVVRRESGRWVLSEGNGEVRQYL